MFNLLLGAISCCLWHTPWSFMEYFASQTSDTLYCPNELMKALWSQREHGNTTTSTGKAVKE